MSSIKAIIFDLGGTLLHLDYPYISTELRKHGYEIAEADFFESVSRINHKMEEVLAANPASTDASRWQIYFDWLCDDLQVELDRDDFILNRLKPRHASHNLWNYVLPGTQELLKTLKSSYRLAMISNSDGRAEQKTVQYGLRPHLEFVIDSHCVGIEKPDPKIFDLALEKLALYPGDCLYIGDIYSIDVLGARAAGLTPILIDNLYYHRKDCHVIPSLFHLPELLDSIV
jgi:putative hydrolase of the HAD superfamily